MPHRRADAGTMTGSVSPRQRTPLRRLAWPAFPSTPQPGTGRDLALDVVRSWSLIVVVLGHFIMQITHWPAGETPTTGNTLSSGNAWPYLTWILQVMPLFFIAGGAVNRGSWARHHGSWAAWMWQRTARLMRPTVVFLLSIGIIFTLVSVTVDRDVTDALVAGITGPLWFLAVYLPVTALTPLTTRLHQHHKWLTMVVLLLGIISTDILRLTVAEPFGALNLLLVWVFVHQLGYWYDDGIPRRIAGGIIGIGLGLNIVLTQITRTYPTSLVGIPTEKFSNMAPPDIILVNHALVLLGLFVLLAPRLRRWLTRPRALRATTIAGITAMTLYLWHMAVLVGWISALHLAGLTLPTRMEGTLVVPDGLPYWLWLIPCTIGYAALTWTLVRYLWPFEYLPLPGFDSPRGTPHTNRTRSGLGVAFISLGLLIISGAGMSGFPLALHTAFGLPANAAVGYAGIALGVFLLRQPRTVPKRTPARSVP